MRDFFTRFHRVESNGTSAARIENSILWYNASGQVQGSADVAYSDIQGGWVGIGNISNNPIFNSLDRFDLFDGSPCIDAGNPDSVLNDTCFPPSLGTNRNDMGAYGGPGACGWPILPRIVTQPRNVVTCLGMAANFSVTAIGEAPLTYQWHWNGAPLNGATNSSFTISSVSSNDAGYYVVVVSNAYDSVWSEPASLTVHPVCLSVGLYAGLTIGGVVGQTYRVEYASELRPISEWLPLTNIYQSASEVLWIDPEPADSQRKFYRVFPTP